MNNLYFDWAAASPFDDDILNTALELSKKAFANPSSVHKAGLYAKEILQEYRERTAACLGVPGNTIYYTSGGTESSHLILVSLLLRPAKGSIVVSSIEHPAVKEQASMLTHCGWDVLTVPSDSNGIITSEAVLSKIRDDTALVCVMAVNNETGAIQPVNEIAQAINSVYPGKKKPKFHVDAVQAAGKIPFSFCDPLIDSLCISAHKIGGPRGIGILCMKARQEPFLRGGGQENGIRSGTENLFGAIALCLALEKYSVKTELDERFTVQKNMTSSFIRELRNIPSCSIIPASRQDPLYCDASGYDTRFSPWIIQAALEGIPSEVLVRSLSEKGLYISTGSACSSRKLSRPVLEAMNVSREHIASAVRFSFGYTTKESEVSILLDNLKDVVKIFS